MLLAPYASPESRLEMVFHAFDTNLDGVLSRRELQIMLIAYGATNLPAVGFGPNAVSGRRATAGGGSEGRNVKVEVDILFKALDLDRSGSISLSEFIGGLRQGKSQNKTKGRNCLQKQVIMSQLRSMILGAEPDGADTDEESESSKGSGLLPRRGEDGGKFLSFLTGGSGSGVKRGKERGRSKMLEIGSNARGPSADKSKSLSRSRSKSPSRTVATRSSTADRRVNEGLRTRK